MTINEYSKIKEYTYKDYCHFLLQKYGPAKVDYFDLSYNKIKEITRTDEGLFCHHIKENEIPNLSDVDIAREVSFDFQRKENLVYCNWLEHILLHLLIAEENPASGLGIGGANIMIQEIESLYENVEIKLPWVQNCFSVIENDFDVFESLIKRRDDRHILLEHNAVVYTEMVETLKQDNKTVVVIGTGGWQKCYAECNIDVIVI